MREQKRLVGRPTRDTPVLAGLLLLAACTPALCAPFVRVVEPAKPSAGAPQPAPAREVTALPAAGPVQTDGVLDEPCWQSGLWIGGFTLVDSGGKLPLAATEFKVRFDDQHLYLAVRAAEPNMTNLRESAGPTRDAPILHDDGLELWLDADGLRREAYHLAYSVAGARYDAQQTEERPEGLAAAPVTTTEDRSWQSRAQAAFRKGADQWTCELEVPVQDLGLPSVLPGSVWALNLLRDRYAFPGTEQAEYSSPTGVGRAPMAGWISLQMGVGPLELSSVDLGALGLGENLAQFSLRGLDPELPAVDACLAIDDRTGSALCQHVTLAPEAQTVRLPYELQEMGDFRLVLEVRQPDTGRLLCLKRAHRRLDSPIRLWPSSAMVEAREPWSVDAELRVGSVSLPRTVLEVALVRADAASPSGPPGSTSGRTVARHRLKPSRTAFRLQFDFRHLKRPGDFRVVFTVVDGRTRLGQASVPLSIVAPSKPALPGGQR